MPDLDITSQLEQLRQSQLIRTRPVVEGPQDAYLSIDGKTYLSFASNDYLGLANHPVLVAAAHRALEEYGVGAGGSALVTGHTKVFETLEKKLAEWVGLPKALYFSTGYMASLGVIPALVGQGDTVFCDRLNHACLIDGARLSRAQFRVYPHRDLDTLERLLIKCSSPKKVVISDTVFSMDGDIAPLPELVALCERHNAWLMLDDAHGFGVLGENGRGCLEHFKIHSSKIIYMATLGKAAGVFGAFIAGAQEVIEWLMQRARPYLFTTASPAVLGAALLESVAVIQTETWRRTHLRALIAQLKAGLTDLPWHLLPSETPIQPLLVGENPAALALMHALREQGIWVPAIRPPTVPKGTARLRISLSAAHSHEDIQRLIETLRDTLSQRVSPKSNRSLSNNP